VHYEAGAHAAQMKILRTLLLSDTLSFSELARATELSNDHANFHLQQLIKSSYVEKQLKSHGIYKLTRSGKEYANRMDTEEALMEKQPKLSVVIIVEREDGLYLQQQRLKQPYYGFWGHLTGKIRWGETMLEAASRELFEETGLTANVRVAGMYHKLDYDEFETLLEDKYFCIIHATQPVGELLEQTNGQRNEWMTLEDFESKDKKFGSVVETIEIIRSGRTAILEQKYIYQADDY
jgi:ADP-ribose pyrophosphatase YjhB (NUDIX family)/predicted transcriptional regulator